MIDPGICVGLDLKLRAPKHPSTFPKFSDTGLLQSSLSQPPSLEPFVLSFLSLFILLLILPSSFLHHSLHFCFLFSITWTFCLHLTCVSTSVSPTHLSLSPSNLKSCFLPFFKISKFIYLFLAALGLRCRLSLVAESRGYSSLWCVGSRHRGFSSCGSGSRVQAQ